MALSISNRITNPIKSIAKAGLKTAAGLLVPGAAVVGAASKATAPKKTVTGGLMSTPAQAAPVQTTPKPVTSVAPAAPRQTAPMAMNTAPAPEMAQSRSSRTMGSSMPASSISFPGIVRGLVSTEAPRKRQDEFMDRIAQSAVGSADIGKSAREIAERYGSEIARIGQLGAGAVAGNLSTGTNVVGSGNAAIASQSASQRMNALAQGLGSELQGVQQQLAGQEAQTAGLGTALTGGLTQQQIQQAGLLGAGGLFPDALRYAGLGGGSLDPQTRAFSLAQQVRQGLISPQDAEAQLSSLYGGLGPNLLNQALQGQGFNYISAQGQAAGQSALAQATGGSAAAGSVGNLTQQLSEMQAAAGGAEANFALLMDIARQGGINQGNVPILNTLEQNVKRGVASDTAVVNFKSILNTVRSQYAAIIGGGTVTVEALQEAQNLIPDNVSMTALQALEENLARDAQNRAAGIQQQIGALGGSGGGVIGWDQI